MLTYVVDNNNKITRTVPQTIMQKSNLVDNIHILVPRYYQGVDMVEFSCVMEYILPSKKASRVYDIALLSANDINYDNSDYVEYLLSGDTNFTDEAGDIEFQLSWQKVGIDSNGVTTQYVRKTLSSVIKITPITVWSDIIPDAKLTALDQRLIAMEAMAKQYAEFSNSLSAKMVTDITLDSEAKKLQLMTETAKIGNGVNVKDISELVAEDIVGKDLDGVSDGVTHIDEIDESKANTPQTTNLDEII